MACSLIALFTLFGILTISEASAEQKYDPIVHLKNGQIRGRFLEVEDSQPVNLFQGIRYGHAERFALAKPTGPWTGVLNATSYQFTCPQKGAQSGSHPTGGYLEVTSSEDCLYLNIWAPLSGSSSKRPVMFWIHGGSFTSGTSFTQTYDGRQLASRGDVLVVTLNYRLGLLGLLTGGTLPSNLQLHDQILALQWVKENIGVFGGDPRSVTVFGESSGSMCVGALLLSPLASGLFHRAILQSGSPNSLNGAQSKADSLGTTLLAAKALNCSSSGPIQETIECIRKQPVDRLVALTSDLAYRPVYGDTLLPLRPAEALKVGKFNHKVDVLYGGNRDESMAVLAKLFPLNATSTSKDLPLPVARAVLVKMLTTTGASNSKLNATEVADFYLKNVNTSAPFEIRRAISDALGDYFLTCPTVLMVQALGKAQPTSHYYSYQLMQGASQPVFGCDPPSIGVCHGDDLPYVFGLPYQLRGTLYTEDDVQLSGDMMRAWSNFAKSGSPGKLRGIEWTEAFNQTTGEWETNLMELNSRRYRMQSGFYRNTCEQFWKAKIE